MDRGLVPLDWVVVGLYGAGMIVVGALVGRRQKTTDDYYIGGGRMGSTVIGISLFATLLSTISYLAMPSEMINKGPAMLFGIIGLPLAYVLVGYLLIPALMRRRVTSAYELIEQRLGLIPRLLAVAMFLALRLVWMGLMVHAAAKAGSQMMGVDPAAAERAVPWIVVVCSVVAVAYTALGGLRAVVFTDVVQFLLLLGGAVLTVVLITIRMDGFQWFPTAWSPHWDQQPFFSVDPHERVTVIGSILAVTLWWVATCGSDQTAIQRFMATGNPKAARRSFMVNAIADAVVSIVLGLVGFALLGFFLQNAGPGQIADADKLFPDYIANHLPMGISGLVVAAMFAAVMSSLDSGINSVTAVIQVDLIDRFRGGDSDRSHNLWVARGLSVGIGVVIILLNAFLLPNVEGNIMKQTQTMTNLLVCPLFCLFFLALFVRSATSFGAITGTIYAIATAVLVAFWDDLSGLDALSFQWIGPCSLVVGILMGISFSRLSTNHLSRCRLGVYSVAAAVPVVIVFLWTSSLRPSTG